MNKYVGELVGTVISLGISFALLYGNQQWQDFASFFILITTVISGLFLFFIPFANKETVTNALFLWPLSGFTAFALVVSDHPILSAFYLIISFIGYVMLFEMKNKT